MLLTRKFFSEVVISRVCFINAVGPSLLNQLSTTCELESFISWISVACIPSTGTVEFIDYRHRIYSDLLQVVNSVVKRNCYARNCFIGSDLAQDPPLLIFLFRSDFRNTIISQGRHRKTRQLV